MFVDVSRLLNFSWKIIAMKSVWFIERRRKYGEKKVSDSPPSRP